MLKLSSVFILFPSPPKLKFSCPHHSTVGFESTYSGSLVIFEWPEVQNCLKQVTELGVDACIMPLLYPVAFTHQIKMEVGCVCVGEEYFCISNTYQSPTKWMSSCHCKGLEDLFVVLFQGTVMPTHYIVWHDTANMKTDHVQQLMYKLYCNWPGTVRVPAACQVSIVQDTSDWQDCLYFKGLCCVKYLTFRYCYMSKHSYMFWPWMVVIMGSYVKEIEEAIFTSAVCSLRSQTVYFCSPVYFCSTVYCTVWAITLQIAAVNVAFLLSFINSLMMALFSSENM